MPSAAARRLYEDQIPSFMSVFDPEAENIDDRGLVTVVDSKLMGMDQSCAGQFSNQSSPNQQPQLLRPMTTDPSTHRHHDSTSTQNSESADSSPTTTLTTDTSSLSDPSPSSSPDSPVNLVPLNSFPATNFGGLSSSMNTLTVGDSKNMERPMTSPSPRRARNMKGLSIQPPFGGNLSSTNLVSEPASPSFIKPKIPAMKRKPSQLSLKTDSTGLGGGSNIIKPITLEMPSSPGLPPPMLQRRALKHSTSSPHMLSSLKSATFGPSGGMTFPTVLERGESGLSQMLRPHNKFINGPGLDTTILEEDSPIKAQLASRAAMDFEPYHEQENNEDSKSPGYPDGPIAIYEDNVYLYLEPTAEEAAKFDVVINVAREVLNPFQATSKEAKDTEMPDAKEATLTVESPIPDTAVSTASFATAFEYPTGDDHYAETPTTPKAVNPLREPEYIHMPWDHNTNIATDLMMLCEKIEKRTKEGKKVLVHCQQGASRSASLIIAYGLYQNPGMSVNDAYYSAQKKSRWISPNMRLMYCLQDFQKEIAKRKLPRSGAGPRSGRSPTKHRLTLSADAIDVKPKEPLTAPLPEERDGSPNKEPSPDRSPMHLRGQSTPNLEAISPGPSSAPSSFSWSEKDVQGARFPRFNIDNIVDMPTVSEPEPVQEEDRQAPSIHLSAIPARSSSFFKPPPSPGFGAQRFGSGFPGSEGSFPNIGGSFPSLGGGGFPTLNSGFPTLNSGFPTLNSGFPSQGGGFQSLGFSSLNNMGASEPAPSFNQPLNPAPINREVTVSRALPDDDALLSPRVETMTNNPLHESFSELAGMKFVESPPTPAEDDGGLFSPRQTMFPRDPFIPFGRPTQVADPRSPPTKGETPIVRSIDEML